MSPVTVRVAAVQLEACGEDVEANAARAEVAVRAAAAAGAELVVLPELSVLPYFCGEKPAAYRHWAQPVDGPLTRRFAELAAELRTVVVLGLFELDVARGTRHNAAVVLEADGAVVSAVDRTGNPRPTTRKLHLPVGDDPPPGFDEPAHFTPGDALGVHVTGTFRLGALVCYDRRFPECWRQLRALDAQLVAVPVAGSGGDGPDFLVAELRTHARENGLVAICANKVGTEWAGGRPTESIGSSCVVGADGAVLAHRPAADGPGLVLADVDLGAIAAARTRWPYFDHRRTDLFGGPASARPSGLEAHPA